MNSIYRQVITVSISLVLIIVAFNKCQNKQAAEQWNPALEKQMYDVFYSQSAGLTTSEKARKVYSDCCVSKMKELFPKGISNIESQMSDSVKIAIMQMGVECSKALEHHLNIWQPEVKDQLKLKLYSLEETKLLPESVRKEYVDCIAFKVTAEFPNGLNEEKNKVALQQFIQKSRTACLVLVSNKYPDLKKGKHKTQK